MCSKQLEIYPTVVNKNIFGMFINIVRQKINTQNDGKIYNTATEKQH